MKILSHFVWPFPLFLVVFSLNFTIEYSSSYSQETDSRKTRVVLIEIFMLFWNLPSDPKHRGWLQENIVFPDRNKQFTGDFMLIWKKQRLISFNLQRDGTGNGLSNIKETFAENLQLKMSILHQIMSIFQGYSLKFMWWLGKWQNVKKKYVWCVRSQSKYWNNMQI